MCSPVFAIALQRSSEPQHRSLLFSLLYSATNVAALAAGLLSDAYGLKQLRLVLLTAAGASALFTALVYARLADVPAPANAPPPSCARVHSTLRDPVFWRIAVFSGALLGVKSVYRHLDASLPKYLERTIGDQVHFGYIYSLNPLLIVVLAPLIGARVAACDIYWSIVVGTTLSALAPLALATAMHSVYVDASLFVVVLSLGEALYSPRLAEFTLALAPPGLEGVYSSLASAPLLVVKLLVGVSSGELFASYCGRDETIVRCHLLWYSVAAGAASTPLLLVVLKRWLYNDTSVQWRLHENARRAHTDEAANDSILLADGSTVPAAAAAV